MSIQFRNEDGESGPTARNQKIGHRERNRQDNMRGKPVRNANSRPRWFYTKMHKTWGT